MLGCQFFELAWFFTQMPISMKLSKGINGKQFQLFKKNKMWVLLSVSVTNETSPCAKFASHVKLDGRVNTAKAPTKKMHRNYISTKCKILPQKVG